MRPAPQDQLVHPDARLACGLQLEAVFDQGLQTHALHDRQHVRQGRGVLAAVELETEAVRRVACRAVGPHRHRLHLAQGLDHLQVGQGVLGPEQILVARREGVAIPGVNIRRQHPVAGVAQGFLEAVAPGAHTGGDLGLDSLDPRLAVFARIEADDVVGARQGQVGEGGVVGRQAPVPGLGQDLARLLRQARVEAAAGHIEQDGHEPVEGIPAHEQAQAGPVVEVHDALGDRQQLVLGDLEQLVARIALQHIVESPAVVAGGRLTGPGQHIGHLLPDQGHLGRRLIIGLGGEQPDQPHLAHGPAVRPVALDPDIVEIGPPVYARDAVGLGHHQRLGRIHHPLERGGQDRRF